MEGQSPLRSIVLRTMAANYVAAAVTFWFLVYVVRRPGNGPVGPAFTTFVITCAVTLPLSWLIGMRLFGPLGRWFEAGAPPDPAMKQLAVAAPRRAAFIALGFWLVTGVCIGGAPAISGGSALAGLRDGVVVLGGGAISSALSFLLVERRGRPFLAKALAGMPPSSSTTVGLRPRFVLSWALGSGIPLFGIVMGEITPGPDDLRISTTGVVVLAVIGIVVGGFVVAVATQAVAVRIDAVTRALLRVRAGDLSVELPVDDAGEVGQLQAGLNEMVEGLRERQELADLFGRHVGEEVAREALRQGVGLGGEKRQASALFVDIVGSTAMAEQRDPTAVVAMLNDFFAAVVHAVGSEGGWVNKFEGDGALCIFGAPAVQPDHAARALRAACKLQAALGRLRASHPELDAGIGLSSGTVVAGNVGAEERYEYTVIGDPVNEAARLTEEAKRHPGRVLASPRTVTAGADEADGWEPCGELALRGRTGTTLAYAPRPGRPEPLTATDTVAG